MELFVLRSILAVIVMVAVTVVGISRWRHFTFLRIVRRSETDLRDAKQEINLGVSYVNDSGKMLRLMDAALSLDEAVEIAAGFCKRLLPSRAGGLYLIDSDRHGLVRRAGWGSSALPLVISCEDCWALRTGATHRFAPGETPLCAHFVQSELNGSVCLPLRSQGELTGLIVVEDIAKLDHEEVHRQMIANLVDWMALALRGVRTRENLHLQSVSDPLTGLFNRRYLDATLPRELKRAAREGEPLSVVLIDLDYFKRVNDTFGHDMGDALLREVAAVLRKSVRASDVACRYGGEELTLILPNCSQRQACLRAEEIRNAIAAIALTLNGKSLSASTASFGVAAYPEHGHEADVLLAAADKALYQAKRSGRNCVVAYEAVHFPPSS